MIWNESDERSHLEDSLRNGDFTIMARHLVKVGNKIYNLKNITVIAINASNLRIKTVECGPGDYWEVDTRTPEGKAFLAWLTDEQICIDVMRPLGGYEPETTLTPQEAFRMIEGRDD